MAETGKSISYGTLETTANQGAHLLRRLEIENDDTIAIWLPNLLEYYQIYWAAQRAGLYICPISTALSAEEAAYIIQDCGAKLLVTNNRISAVDDFLTHHRPASLKHIYCAGSPMESIPSWENAISSQPETPIKDEQAGFHLVYSSGTTGRPKGIRVPLSQGPADEPLDLADRVGQSCGITDSTVYLSPAPLYHTAPLAYTTSCHRLGATVVLMEKFDPGLALEAIEKYRVSVTQMVPTMFIRMLSLPEEQRHACDLSSLEVVVHAAAPCPIEVKRQMIDWFGPIIYEYYGGSEGNGSTFITPQEWLERPGSVGKAAWGVIHVCGENGEELPPHQNGLVYFEGPSAFEYLNDPEKTTESRHPDHPDWSTLGDIGYLDTDGYLFLTDRKSFMIISGGVNIYPQETENLLIMHPKVADVAVIGVPHKEMGEEVKAVVQPMDWNDANETFASELIEFCRENISHIKCPRSIDFDPNLPRLDNGKLYKKKIKERYSDAS